MAYFLGRDVSVSLTTENTTNGVTVAGVANSTGDFADNKGGDPVAVADLTGVDIGLAVTDEDITYMGKKTVLKAEIKRETTISLTKKKSDMVWDTIFEKARWGIDELDAIGTGLSEPPSDGTSALPAENFGYAIKCVISATDSSLTVHNAQITGHTVSLNADGTTEETMEFVSYADVTVA